MENLVFLLIVLIVIVSNVINIRKRMKAQQQKGEQQSSPTPERPREKSGWRESAEKFFEQLKEEIEPASPERSGERSGEHFGKSRADRLGQTRRERVDQDRGFGDPEASPGEARTRMSAGEPSGTKDREAVAEARGEASEPAGQGYVHQRHALQKDEGASVARKKKADGKVLPAHEFARKSGKGYSVAQMQKAVIWSEILGPPIALRKEERTSWER